MIYNITNKPRMIMRDANGNLHIINRSDCKNDTVYYQNLFNIKKGGCKDKLTLIDGNNIRKQNPP